MGIGIHKLQSLELREVSEEEEETRLSKDCLAGRFLCTSFSPFAVGLPSFHFLVYFASSSVVGAGKMVLPPCVILLRTTATLRRES